MGSPVLLHDRSWVYRWIYHGHPRTHQVSNVYVNGIRPVVLGDYIWHHYYGGMGIGWCRYSGIHKMNQASSNVYVNGIPVCREDDYTTCGYRGIMGSQNVFVGG